MSVSGDIFFLHETFALVNLCPYKVECGPWSLDYMTNYIGKQGQVSLCDAGWKLLCCDGRRKGESVSTLRNGEDASQIAAMSVA